MGDTLWTHIYSKLAGQSAGVKDAFEIDGGRIVAGGFSFYTHFVGTTNFYHYTPWFMLLDSAGNIIRDTLYGSRYMWGGAIINDMNGGYMHYGRIDSIPVPDASDDPQNFPFYVAHLDTNFAMTWITDLSVSSDHGQRQVFGLKQLHDSSYIVFGDDSHNGWPFIDGWASKISRTGDILWTHYYGSDTINETHIRDMIEKPDGSLVFIGASFNDTLPSWHQRRDLWILGTDSNGCEIPGCSNEVSAVQGAVVEAAGEAKLWPNPTYGQLTLQAPGQGSVAISSMDGRIVAQYAVAKGNTTIQLPSTLAPGIYMATYNAAGKQPQTLRFVYQP